MSLLCVAGDNANERQNQMIDDRLGRRLVQSLILCRTTYERFGSPKCDKFASAPHNPEYKKFAEELKSVFQSSSLQPYPFIVRSPGMQPVDQHLSSCVFLAFTVPVYVALQ